MVDDINAMHRYRDAILTSGRERLITTACVLCPGRTADGMANHFRSSLDSVGVGGLPFLPSARDLVRQRIERLIGGNP